MKRSEMIKSKQIFSDIINTGKFKKNKFFVIYNKENNLNNTRYGIAISNKIGNAVIRNRLKRQTRSIIDKKKFLFQNNKDYIIMIRKGSLEEDFETKLLSIEDLFKENK